MGEGEDKGRDSIVRAVWSGITEVSTVPVIYIKH